MPDTKSVLLSAGDDVKVWDTDGMQIIKQYNYHESNIKDVAWNHNNTVVASTAANGDSIFLCEIRTKHSEKPKVIGQFANGEQQTSVCFGARGKTLFSGGTTGDVNAWDCQLGKLRKSFNGGHQSPITCLSVNYPETHVLSACTGGKIIVWHADSGEAISSLRPPHSHAIRGLDHSPWKEHLFGTASDDGSVCLWDCARQVIHHSFKDSHVAPAMDLSFSPLNHLLLASCGLDKRIILYDLQHKHVAKTLECDQPLTSLSFLENGMHICIGSSLGNLYKCDLRKMGEKLQPIGAHSTSVQRLVLQTIANKLTKSKSSSSTRTDPTATNAPKSSRELAKNDALKSPNKASKHVAAKKNGAEKTTDRKSKTLRNDTKGVNGRKYESSAYKHINDLPNGNVSTSPVGRKQTAISAKGLLNTPAVNNSYASSRDTLGSYCEGVFSPLAPEYRGSGFMGDGSAPPGTNHKESLAFSHQVEEFSEFRSEKSREMPGARKSRNPPEQELVDAQELVDSGGLQDEARDSMGSYCEGVFSPLASEYRGKRDFNPEVFNPHTNPGQYSTEKIKSKRSLMNGSQNEHQTSQKSSLLEAKHVSNLKAPSASYHQSLGKLPPSPLTYNSYGAGNDTTPQKTLSTSQSDSDSLHDSPPDSSRLRFGSAEVLRKSQTEKNEFGAVGQDLSSGTFQYQVEFLKNYVHGMVEHVVEENVDHIRDEIRHLHLQMIKMFAEQEEKMQKLAEQCSVNPVLLQENERLRLEVDRLKRKY